MEPVDPRWHEMTPANFPYMTQLQIKRYARWQLAEVVRELLGVGAFPECRLGNECGMCPQCELRYQANTALAAVEYAGGTT